MKIAYLCADFGIPICGAKGASIHVRGLTRALSDLGHEVVIFTPRVGGEPASDFPVPIRGIDPAPHEQELHELLRADPSSGPDSAREIRALLYASTLRREALRSLQEFEPDLIYERYSLCGTAGLALARELGVPFILEVNAPLCDEQAAHRGLAFAQPARAVERVLLRSADRVLAVSRSLERWLLELGVRADRVVVLPNAVDPAPFEAAAGEREAIRAQLGLADRRTLGFLGTLKPWHDIASLVSAVALLHQRGGSPHLLIIGDGPERGNLEQLARREDVAQAVTFLGTVPHELVPGYLAALDLAVAPYGLSERFYFSPLKLFEYLAAGLPVVAADVGEISECIRPGKTGALYPAGDVRALADSIGLLLEDSAHAATLGRNGREHVRAHHTWHGNARAVVEAARLLARDVAQVV